MLLKVEKLLEGKTFMERRFLPSRELMDKAHAGSAITSAATTAPKQLWPAHFLLRPFEIVLLLFPRRFMVSITNVLQS